MIKQKLINKRVEKELSQEEFASLMGITQSQYSRRENGVTKISKKEWDKMAKFLDTPLDEIYEPEDGIYIINSGNYSGSQNHFQHIPDHVLETMRKYIEKLENEIKVLKRRVTLITTLFINTLINVFHVPYLYLITLTPFKINSYLFLYREVTIYFKASYYYVQSVINKGFLCIHDNFIYHSCLSNCNTNRNHHPLTTE